MNKILLIGTGVIFSASLLLFSARPDGLLHFYALDIGQGDSLLIRTPSGKNILIDGGPKDAVLGELSDVLPFFDRQIDDVFLTHPDADHLEGLIYVIKNYPVGHVYFTGVNKSSALYQTFLHLLKEKNIPTSIADQNSDLHFDDGVTLDVLFPFHQMLGSNVPVNNSSIVARLVYGENEVMLTGDAEEPEEEELVAAAKNNQIDLSADMLKVGHHGSTTSTSEAFLEAVHPKIAVISVGKNNKFNHPRPEVINRLAKNKIKTYRTDEMGRVEVIFSKAGIEKIETKKSL